MVTGLIDPFDSAPALISHRGFIQRRSNLCGGEMEVVAFLQNGNAKGMRLHLHTETPDVRLFLTGGFC